MAEPIPQNTISSPLALFHLSLNRSCSTTIILIHGFSSSHREYTFVQPYLSNYHLLLPDLPGHSNSAHIRLETLTGAADLLAALIRAEAHGGRAHVVGLSMGGAIALLLAQRHPDIVLSLFGTGVAGAGDLGKPRSSWLPHILPSLLVIIKPVLYAPRPVQEVFCRHWGMELPEGLVEDVRSNLNFGNTKRVSGQIHAIDFKTLQSLTTRTLIVAGARQDSVEGARLLGRIVKQGNLASCGVSIPGAIHTWDMQFPRLFANGIKAWINGGDLPEEFKTLE